MVSLREYQSELVDALRQDIAKHRRVIMTAPPGAGKTRMAKHIIDRKLSAKVADGQTGRVLFAVHRRGLVENASDSFNEEPAIDHGLIMSGIPTTFHKRCQVASIDTLNSWWCSSEGFKGYTFDLIIFDECHSHVTKLQTFLSYHDKERKAEGNQPAFVLGLSATPQGDGVADVFKSIVSGPEPKWLTEQGYLKPFKYYNGTAGALNKLVRTGQRFTNDSNNAAMEGLNGDLVRDWEKYAETRSTVGFFSSRKNAREAMVMLKRAGIKAEYVDGETPDDERRTLYKLLNQGEIDYLCNVGVIERGTDIPRIGCIQLCTAIGSIVRYRQMIGRGSRPHPDVSDCMVLDHGGNVDRHGFFDDEIEWSLDRKVTESKEAAEHPTLECPNCGRKYRGGKCSECEYEPTQKERKSQGLEFDGTELKEVKKTSKPKKPISNERIMIESLYAAGKSGRTFKQAIGMAYAKAKQRNQQFRVPRSVEIAGRRVEMVRFGSPDQVRLVSEIYSFTSRG